MCDIFQYYIISVKSIQHLKSYFGPLSPLRLSVNRFRSLYYALKYKLPLSKISTTCITGTDGKSSTCVITNHVMETCGLITGLSCSLDSRIAGEVVPNTTKMTTPDPGILQSLFARMRSSGVTHSIIETSSHSLVQWRLFGVRPSVAILTNLTREHLDYHGTMQEYARAKGLLFQKLGSGTAILYRDDEYFDFFKSLCKGPIVTFGFSDSADIFADTISLTPTSSSFCVHFQGSIFNAYLPLPGKVNILNALAGLGAAISHGISIQDAVKALESVPGIPGRLQPIHTGQPFDILVDYAVTPAALEKLYEGLSQTVSGRIIHVFGSCGERDRGKRPIMGSIVASHADICIITNEDPYHEDPLQIQKEVLAGCVESGKAIDRDVFVISDRREALARALSFAQPGDLVIATGKGSETAMQIGDQRIPWNESEVIHEELKKITF